MHAQSSSRSSQRPIDRRRVPPVAGIDIEHALNFLDIAECGREYAYDYYTSGRTFYHKGSRPMLEKIVKELAPVGHEPNKQIDALTDWVVKNVRWAGYYEKEIGRKLPADRAASEEELIESGFGWCNEQARLFCSLVQVAGYPSRLAFGRDAEGLRGHVVSEILTPDGWLVVDQSLGVAFRVANDPVCAWDLCHGDEKAHATLTSLYREYFAALHEDLGKEILMDSFAMALMPNPLLGFSRIGVQNYFVH